MRDVFNGQARDTARDMRKAGLKFGISMGRRAPMHRMHVDCIHEIMEAGLKPVIVIGSVNGPDSPLYDPVRNPLTVEQQKEQFRRAVPKLDSTEVQVIMLQDYPDDDSWMKNLLQKIRDAGLHDKSAVHFRSKAADAADMGKAIKPLSQYAQSFADNGLAVWQSFNSREDDDYISATDIRAYDLENLTQKQRDIIAAPDYILELAQRARAANPDRALLEKHGVPLTVLDLAFDRLRREANISTAEIVAAAGAISKVDCKSLAAAATAAAKACHTRPCTTASKKPVMLIGPSVSPETAAQLKADGSFDMISASIGQFQSGEQFVELFYGEKAGFEANAERIKGAKAVIVQSTGVPVGDNIQHLLEMAHTLKKYGAAEVTAVIPFAAYARQDRAFDRRFASVAAELLPLQLKAAGVDKIVTFAMHSQASAKFYKDTFGDNCTLLDTTGLFAKTLRDRKWMSPADVVSGAPDGADKPGDEGQRRARDFAESYAGGSTRFTIAKAHKATSETEVTGFSGDVAGKDCVLVDDMVDGGGTLINAARLLKEQGARSVTCCVTHAILTSTNGTALEKMMTARVDDDYAINSLVITDSVPEAAEKIAAFARQYPELAQKIETIPLAPAILAEVTRQPAPTQARVTKLRQARG